MHITPFAAANEALERASNALSSVGVPFEPHFQFLGFKFAKYTLGGRFDSGFVNILATIRTPIDFKIRIEIPVPIQNEHLYDPDFFIYGGKTYKISQENLNSLLFGGEMKTKKTMNLFNDPRVITFPEVAYGMFSTFGIPEKRLENYPGSLNWSMG